MGFLISPLLPKIYCLTKYFLKGNIKLSSAIAISGAAANQTFGVEGKGVTRNPVVSLLMALLNIRLGYWITTPKPEKWFSFPQNHFVPGFYKVLDNGYDKNKKFLQISDGGHFKTTNFMNLFGAVVS